ncbi:hypothetical protein ACHAXR_007111 [Thalassiosira sp. AJA248-18]
MTSKRQGPYRVHPRDVHATPAQYLSMMRYLVLISTATALSVPTSSKSTIPSHTQVKVWDDVLPTKEQRSALHLYASKSGLEHRCFSRPLANAGGNNIIERSLDAILTEIENVSDVDSEHYVEYWTRQEWRHIEAHADVDENLSKKFDQNSQNDDIDMQSKYSTTYQGRHGHRYPIYGHVLYLQVGSDVKGPTCVFPKRSSGGDLLRSMHEKKSEEQCANDDEKEEVQLVTVPAVAGRLLRFDGRDLHAVPRPHDLWMLPFVKGGAEYEPEETWGRSVILFNVWPAGEDPPLDVPLDRNEEDLSESKTTESAFCNPFTNWSEVDVAHKDAPSPTTDLEPNQSVKVWLLGNERRRDHPLRTVPLQAPVEGGRDAVREALAEKSQVTELWLRQK